MREWNRTITEAIEQAKHEMEEQKAKQKQQQNETPPKKESDEKQPEPPSPQPEEEPQRESKEPGKSKDYITTLGRVMIELPHDIEGFFQDGLGADIYAEDVLFREPRHSGFHISGKKQYLGVARVLRIAMNAYFTNPRITITRMRQVPIPTNGPASSENNGHPNSVETSDGDSTKHVEVYVRWVFEGMPCHTGLIGGHESRYEGEFRYAMHPSSGLVAVHEVTAIHPTPPVGFIPSGLARWMGWLSPRGSLSLSRRW
ncbi:hypothetical protein H4R20_005626 [Coemansia guatemalensis]|uniref:Uncharacterized protein n=1 Tax=Coemansia guatemalensis TaxID=2761395 RepID=A0A9W8HPG1_9FUNG|nr:hypothetical protein H4R20_005626 [Coemansia guatemalensis]